MSPTNEQLSQILKMLSEHVLKMDELVFAVAEAQPRGSDTAGLLSESDQRHWRSDRIKPSRRNGVTHCLWL
jgi:hypothetical protein